MEKLRSYYTIIEVANMVGKSKSSIQTSLTRGNCFNMPPPCQRRPHLRWLKKDIDPWVEEFKKIPCDTKGRRLPDPATRENGNRKKHKSVEEEKTGHFDNKMAVMFLTTYAPVARSK